MLNSPIDEIKNRLDVVEVIEGYIKLKKAGKDYKALCPFHKEKNPSFFVSPSKQIWHCFSCNIGGDIFSFVRKIEGVEFPEALRILAKKAGVILKKEDPQIRSQRNVLYEICDESAEYFQKQLGKNKPVQEYLKDRGLKSETIKEFKIGYTDNNWDGLLKHLTEIGYKPKDIEMAGLAVKKDQNTNYFDRFRSRIMFPLQDLNGQVVGFTGRIFPAPSGRGLASGGGDIAKYVNTPETLIYNKSRLVYGLDKAKIEIRKKNQCIAVEGQMDLIMVHQSNYKNAVAVSGTALTDDHLHILKRYTDNLLFSFDADTGGEGATKRAISLAQQHEFNIKVAILNPSADGKDPAEIIKKNPEKWQKIIDNAKPIMEFYFENTLNKYPKNLSVDHKREIAKELLVPIKNLVNVVERAHWLQVLASKLKVEEKSLIEALRRIKSREEGKEIPSEQFSEGSRIKELEEILLGLVLTYPEHLEYLNESLLNTEELKKFLKNLKSDNIKSEKDKFLANYLIFKVEHLEIEEKDVLKEIDFCIRELKRNYLKEELAKISIEIKGAEETSNKQELKKLTKKFCELADQMSQLSD